MEGTSRRDLSPCFRCISAGALCPLGPEPQRGVSFPEVKMTSEDSGVFSGDVRCQREEPRSKDLEHYSHL